MSTEILEENEAAVAERERKQYDKMIKTKQKCFVSLVKMVEMLRRNFL